MEVNNLASREIRFFPVSDLFEKRARYFQNRFIYLGDVSHVLKGFVVKMSDVLSHEELSISYCTDTDVKGSSADDYVELSVHGFSISKAIRIISKESLESVEPLFGQQRLC